MLGRVHAEYSFQTHVVEYSYTRRYKPIDVSPPLSPLLVPNAAPLSNRTHHESVEKEADVRSPLILGNLLC